LHHVDERIHAADQVTVAIQIRNDPQTSSRRSGSWASSSMSLRISAGPSPPLASRAIVSRVGEQPIDRALVGGDFTAYAKDLRGLAS